MKFKDDIPIYLQIQNEIEKEILQGNFKPNEKIPSIRQMAKQYRLNPQTVSNALTFLLENNILYKRRGRGIYVTKNGAEELKKMKAAKFRKSELINCIKKAKLLGLKQKELINIINQIY